MAVRLEWRGDQVRRHIRTTLADRLEMAGQIMEAAVKEEAPVRTGGLRDSIAHETDRTALTTAVEAMAEYAGFVHDGTRKMKPNPFLLRGVRKVANKVISTLAGK